MTLLRVIEFVPAGLSVMAEALGLFDAAGVEVDACAPGRPPSSATD